MRPKRGTYAIALRVGGTETVSGYVVDGWGMRKSGYSWELTRRTDGMGVSIYPPIERRADALAMLERIAGLDVDAARVVWKATAPPWRKR